MDILGVIPARFSSTRFPGKPLVEILGISLIERVWKQCIKAVDQKKIYIATDNDKIFEHVQGFGGQAIMTSTACLTGTDRVYEAACQLGLSNVINIQGDEPLIEPKDITLFIDKMETFPDKVFNGMSRISDEEEYRSTTVPKVVARPDGRLMYMSRAAIPTNKNLEFCTAYKQVCIYAFPVAKLSEFVKEGIKTPIEESVFLNELDSIYFSWETLNVNQYLLDFSSDSDDVISLSLKPFLIFLINLLFHAA